MFKYVLALMIAEGVVLTTVGDQLHPFLIWYLGIWLGTWLEKWREERRSK